MSVWCDIHSELHCILFGRYGVWISRDNIDTKWGSQKDAVMKAKWKVGIMNGFIPFMFTLFNKAPKTPVILLLTEEFVTKQGLEKTSEK